MCDADKLFRRMAVSGHCIRRVITPSVLSMKLRSSVCVFALPRCHYDLYKHSFVLRNLFEEGIISREVL